MLMSSDDLIHHMACDFSQRIAELVPNWEHPNQPADTIYEAFGDSPSETSVIAANYSGDAIAAVQQHMTQFWETDQITSEVARQLVQRAIINNIGRDAIS